MFNFTYVRCWICKWYRSVCMCISMTDSGKHLRYVSALFLISVSLSSMEVAQGAAPVSCMWLCHSKLHRPRARCPAVDLVHVRLTPRGACSHHTPAPLPLSSLPPAPSLPSRRSFAPAWLQEQWTQMQNSTYFVRSFLLILVFNTLVSVKFNIIVSLGEVLPGGNTVLQSEYFLLNLGKFYRSSFVSSLPLPEPAPRMYCAAALQVFIILSIFLWVLLDIAKY